MSRNLYSLMHVNKYGVKNVIPFKFEKGIIREKLALTTIDSFTSNFISDNDLLFDLKSRGFDLSEGIFQIEYKNRGKNKKLELLYSDNKRLKYFADNNEGRYIIKKDSDFTSYFYFVINSFRIDPKMYDYLKSYNYITSDFLMHIQEFIYYTEIGNNEGIFQSRTKINSYLSSYKNVRDIEFGISKYKIRSDLSIEDSGLNDDKGKQLRLF